MTGIYHTMELHAGNHTNQQCLPAAVRSHNVLQRPLHDTNLQLHAWDSAAFRLRRLGLGAASPVVEGQKSSNMDSAAKFFTDHQAAGEQCRSVNCKE